MDLTLKYIDTNMKAREINCATGKITEREMSAEEIAQIEAMQQIEKTSHS